jgi:hypothetical protein
MAGCGTLDWLAALSAPPAGADVFPASAPESEVVDLLAFFGVRARTVAGAKPRISTQIKDR